MRILARAKKLARLVRTSLYRDALRHGIGASVELERMPFSRDARTVIDAGANRGQFAAFALRECPRATIHSFEPLPGPAETLARFAHECGHGRIVVHRIALGAVAGRSTMHVLSEDDSSSLLTPTPAQLRRGMREVATMGVRVERLDAALSPARIVRPALLKIDVQGGELDVLRGAEGLLGSLDEILVECSYVAFYETQPLAREVETFLGERGWRPRHVLPSILTHGALAQADVLFVRS